MLHMELQDLDTKIVCHSLTGRNKRKSRQLPVACKVVQAAALAAHGLGNEKSAPIDGLAGQGGRAKGRRVELHKLHVGHGCLGAVRHSHAIPGGDTRICGDWVDLQCMAGLISRQHNTRQD